ncbi:extracellular matrix organizing protein FRAS1-like [Centropristis striata]|uniref:extracellular matrix organizing protein FRAS1-like n=1 Tax=Centropristis striata TaxID=184440 RepID=UPI0027DF6E14|nr:extracellular matrix organizing protein FRAS1-like [Centropristis striata]
MLCVFSLKGERLRIPANSCCPECVSSSSVDSCRHQGLLYEHDSQWRGSPCSRCVCSRGGVSCTSSCPPVSCPGGQRPFTPEGECCQQCAGSGESCSHQGTVFRDGEQWRPSLCSRCSCRDGEVQCSVAECQQVVCRQNENLVIQPGRCCPQCVSNPCLSAGTQYQHGDQWQKDSCTTCVCDRGQSKCHTHTCRPVTCDKGQSRVRRAGQCCDECAATKGSCLYEGAVRYHGDLWNATGCEFCSCSRGQVVCQTAQCGRVQCPQGSELVELPGKCCPECSSVKPSCSYQGKSYKDLSRWSPSSCQDCECRDAQVTCYLRSCPTCPPGTLLLPQEARCCPQCGPVFPVETRLRGADTEIFVFVLAGGA